MKPLLGHILAIDPGRCKCGLAIVDPQGLVVQKMVADSGGLESLVSDLRDRFAIDRVVLGDRTHSKEVAVMVRRLGLAVDLVDENNSSIEGRARYLLENTRGWKRLLPLGLRVPDRPYDDYVAVVLAERYFRQINAKSGEPSTKRVADKEGISE